MQGEHPSNSGGDRKGGNPMRVLMASSFIAERQSIPSKSEL